MKTSSARLVATLCVCLSCVPTWGQDIRETDITTTDPASLSRILVEARSELASGLVDAAAARIGALLAALGDDPPAALSSIVATALVLRAATRGDIGDLARADIDAALGHNPGLRNDEALPPATARLLELARRRLVGRFDLETVPSSALVLLDGREVGVSPIADLPVLAGTHFLRITRAGYTTIDHEITVPAATTERVSLRLERKGSVLLLLCDTDGAVFLLDGTTSLGVARRPSPDEADRLITTFNLPIDPYDPSPMLLVEDAPPGRHTLHVEAPCRVPVDREIEVPAGADSTTMIALSRMNGTLHLDGPLLSRAQVGHGEPRFLPSEWTDLCPGPQSVEVFANDGGRTRRTLWVKADLVTRWNASFLPVIAWIGDNLETAATVARSTTFNLVLAEGLSAIDPTTLHVNGSVVESESAIAVLAANRAVLLAWTEGAGDALRLILLASGSPITESIPIRSGSEDDLVAALDHRPTRELPSVGWTTVDTLFLEHPLVAALDPASPAQIGGVRVGDEIETIDGEEVLSATELERRIARTIPGAEIAVAVRQPSGRREIKLSVGLRRSAPDWGAAGVIRSVVIARAVAEIASTVDLARLSELRLRVAQALFALGAGGEAASWLAATNPDELSPDQRGELLFLRGLSARLGGDAVAARSALTAALGYPTSRLVDRDGPLLGLLIPPLLQSLPPSADP